MDRVQSTVLFVVLVTGVFAGCGRKPATENSPPPPVAMEAAPAPDAAAPVPAPPSPPSGAEPAATPDTAPQPETQLSVDLQALNFLVADFFSANMRAPKDVNELITGGYIKQLPSPPPGKKFAIDAKNRRVIVVNK